MTQPHNLMARAFGHLTGANRRTEASAIALAVASKAAGKPAAPPPAAPADTPAPAPAEIAAEPAEAAPAADSADGECQCGDGEEEDDCECDDAEMATDGVSAQAVNAARTRERARCAAIFASPFAVGRESVAAEIAFGTKLSRKEGRALLKSMGPVPEPKPAGLASAMATQPAPRPNAGGAPASATDSRSIASSWDSVLAKK